MVDFQVYCQFSSKNPKVETIPIPFLPVKKQGHVAKKGQSWDLEPYTCTQRLSHGTSVLVCPSLWLSGPSRLAVTILNESQVRNWLQQASWWEMGS